MLHLNNDQVKDLLEDREDLVIQYMEDVFLDWLDGKAKMIPKTYLTVNSKGDFRAMPAQWNDTSGVKWISVYPHNHTLELPTIHGTLLLNDSLTGQPIISMDCAELTAYRTAAVSALAGKHLTMNNLVRTLTFIGCGYQAKLHALMYRKVFPNVMYIHLYDKNKDSAIKLQKWINATDVVFDDTSTVKLPNVECVIHDNLKAACSGTDLITTLTPSTEPYLGLEDIDHPFHINAIGADAVGKRELKDNIWSEFHAVVDDYQQAVHSGEM